MFVDTTVEAATPFLFPTLLGTVNLLWIQLLITSRSSLSGGFHVSISEFNNICIIFSHGSHHAFVTMLRWDCCFNNENLETRWDCGWKRVSHY